MEYRVSAFKAKLEPGACVIYISLACLAIALIASNVASAEDWPTYQHDNQRSGATSENLDLPLSELWRYTPKHAPRPAWPAPAKQDFWHRMPKLNPRVTYDRAFHVAAVGNAVYFGSSADDKVCSLDASTGEVRWSFFTGGPVRLAPSVFAGNVYVGSDDGFVYCLDGTKGVPLWKCKAAGDDRKIAGNGRMISSRPVRTGVLVEDGIAYLGAGLFPTERVYMCALDAHNGSVIWVNAPDNLSPQGYLLASATRLYVPTGRTAPVVFSRRDGSLLGRLSCPRAEGGTYALLTRDALISGPGTKLRALNPNTGDQIATFAGRHIIATDEVSYLLSDDGELSAIDRATHSNVRGRRETIAEEHKKLTAELSDMREKRKTLSGEPLETLDSQIDETVKRMSDLDRQLKELEGSEYRWRSQCRNPYSMILAGDVLLAGGDDRVESFSTADGKLLWTGTVTGKAYGLAVANGRLFVSTDKGTIYCFSERDISDARDVGATDGLSSHQIPPNPPLRKGGTEGTIRKGGTEGTIRKGGTEGTIRKGGTEGVMRKEGTEGAIGKGGNRLSAPEPYPQDELTAIYASAAKHIIDETGIRKGYCLVLGCGEGRLAYELAKQTPAYAGVTGRHGGQPLRIIGIEEDEKKVLAARESLDKAGLYGVRVTVHHGSLIRMPYTDYFANLIVSDRALISGDMPTAADEVFRVLRPFGGTAYLGQTIGAAERGGKLSRSALESWLQKASAPGWEMIERDGLWAVMRRGPLPGSGEWTHQYAEAGNSACSGDRLVRSPMQIQWFGRPGPRSMIDRHNHALAPLCKDGRLFVPAAGENRVIAVDAYNGTILWDVEVPNYRRVGANKDAGNMAVTEDYLYVATEDSCWGLDVATGQHLLTFRVPQLVSEQHYWGYMASVDDSLFGSGEKKKASLTEHSLAVDYEVYFDNKPVATSDYLFCLNRHDGQSLWHYKHGIIINPAIAVGDEHIYFIESRNPAVADGDGRTTLEILLASGYGYLVALNKQTGDEVWEQPVDLPFEHVIHLSFANDTLLIVGTRNEGGHPRYDLYAFNANDGSVKWSNHYVQTNWGINGDHGEQDQHPVIVGNNIYLIESYNYNLQTGEKGSYKLNRGGHGCGTISGSVSHLFARGGNPRMYEITDEEESGTALTRVNRPGCWINIIPAGGLVLIPEFSSGCTCSYPLQTSIALAPKYRYTR
jgi:outer membrane protein assembly factor BamB